MKGALELLAFALNLCFWAGPFLVAWRRRQASLLHPNGIFALYVVFTEAVALSEHWFGWLKTDGTRGLRLETRQHQGDFWFYLAPLLVMAVAGAAFQVGVYLASRRLTPGPHDRFYLEPGMRTLGQGRGGMFTWAAVLAVPSCILPFLLFGEGSGFFWTVPLFYAANFLPLMVLLQYRRLGILMLAAGVPLLGLRGSKGDFIYYLLPLVLYFQGTLLVRGGRLRLRRMAMIGAVLALVIAGTAEVTRERGEWGEAEGSAAEVVFDKVIRREYGFETFALLVHQVPLRGNLVEESWLWREVTELVPSAILAKEKTRTSQEVARRFMPEDYAVLPDAGFYRFFTFSFYHDLGVIGALLGSALIGFVLASLYRIALGAAWTRRATWPILVYLPVPAFTQMFVNGAFGFFFTHALIACLVVATVTALGMFEKPRLEAQSR